ncbi:6-phosphofructokinase [bacterium 210820-DFI.6.37]|nr:6-phosphofructokinase [bacterium 210820-DFI.6.37]
MKLGVLTSGGDAPGMNAAIRAVTRSAIYRGYEVVGFERGFDGLIQNSWRKLETISVSEIIHKGGTILKTARSKDFMTEEGMKKALRTLETLKIKNLVIIGGDGSFRGAKELADHGLNVMGIPGTIDNDLSYTDYTIGFDTAVNTVTAAVEKIIDTSLSHERNTIIEVMGRDCGDIATYTGISTGAELVLIPEIKTDLNTIFRKIKSNNKRGKLQSIIIKAEGFHMKTEELAGLIKQETGTEARVVVLGYLQRGGEPTTGDRILASRMGAEAVRLISDGLQNRCVGIQNNNLVNMPVDKAIGYQKDYDSALNQLADILSI